VLQLLGLVVALWPDYILAIKVATAVITCKQALRAAQVVL
jgi:hypothetical protein